MGKVNFKGDFKYTNIGTVVGTLCYFKPLNRKDGSQYGGEFLINVSGHGSINVRVPSMYKVEQILNEFTVEDRPHVRIPMTQTDCYFAQTGKVYINFTTFSNFQLAKEGTLDTAKGNISGEVVKISEKDGVTSVVLAVYNVDKDGKRITRQDGTPLDPKAVKVDIVDPAIKKQFNNEVQIGSNVTVGYSYINKVDNSYDEFGLPVGNGERISRIEVGKLIVLKNKKEVKPVVEEDPFAGGVEVDPFAFEIDDEDIPF